MANQKSEWNPDWDKVSAEAKPLREAEGGQLYRMENAYLVVLNGEYRQMGRQYGLLLGDQVKDIRSRIKDEFITQDRIPYETISDMIGKPFYQERPRRHKELLAGIAETTGIDIIELTVLDEMLCIEGIARLGGGGGPVHQRRRVGRHEPGRGHLHRPLPRFAAELARPASRTGRLPRYESRRFRLQHCGPHADRHGVRVYRHHEQRRLVHGGE